MSYHQNQDTCNHNNYDEPVRLGRAHYICKKCGKDISMELAFIWMAQEEENENE